jgi:hypothetical protein
MKRCLTRTVNLFLGVWLVGFLDAARAQDGQIGGSPPGNTVTEVLPGTTATNVGWTWFKRIHTKSGKVMGYRLVVLGEAPCGERRIVKLKVTSSQERPSDEKLVNHHTVYVSAYGFCLETHTDEPCELEVEVDFHNAAGTLIGTNPRVLVDSTECGAFFGDGATSKTQHKDKKSEKEEEIPAESRP